MRIQVIQDSKGNNAGVFIPYNDWNELKKNNKELAALENNETIKEEILNNIKQGLEEAKLFKLGKLKTTSAKDFLNEL